ncbi:MAG: hydrogenase expression/formation protein HypE [DPANN group archaeon]|nr:hydrogenase expression/formation protein HypE [DPANN group archaeon]
MVSFIKDDKISLSEGSGGEEMQNLITTFRDTFGGSGNWNNSDNDSATILIGDKYIFFTSDSFVVDPIFFNGRDIGHLAMCGTINDIAVMGAKPLGISVSFVIEEGFSKSDLDKIIKSIADVSKATNIPVVTGDTKVMECGKIDKIIINTSAVGISDTVLDESICDGDVIIVSGSIGDHGASLMAVRLDFDTNLKTDSKPIVDEVLKIKHLIKVAKDPTRGGIAAILNEMAEKDSVQLYIDESKIPVKREVLSLCDVLGISPYEMACEGRFVCVAKKDDAREVVNLLREFDVNADVIGSVRVGKGVVLKTKFGERILSNPRGRIIPRIC